MALKENYVTTATTIRDLLDRIIEVIRFLGPDEHWFIGSDGTICIYSADGKILYQVEPAVDPLCPTQLMIEETNNKNGGK